MKKGFCICPDLDIVDVIGTWGAPLSECKQIKELKKQHLDMNKELKCHIYKGVQYCFCSLKKVV